uniref:Upstream activation factor subunit spp27 n=1 Tax=Ananas comosus var. bracteatus TaxID=296719 RepID=A0A6V7NLL1_ANACO|nr:unnamed protein product [Ananas comosus var. bracteatus]
MVTDEELARRLRELLRSSDLSTTTTAIVRRSLEEHFALDLSHKKAFIREQRRLRRRRTRRGRRRRRSSRGRRKERRGRGGEEEEEEEDEEVSGGGGGSRKRRLNRVNEESKRRGGGFTKLCSLSPELQDFVGESELARTEVVKKLWAYIRENNLQDPNNRRKIICDERLRSLFNVNTIDMFQMNKALTKHIWPLEDAGHVSSARSTPKDKQRQKDKEGSVSPVRSKTKDKKQKKDKNEGKRHKGGSSGLLAPLPLSDELVKFIGTGENTLSRSDVVKRMWDYIKQNNLQDPSNKRTIICDEKLKELFKVDSFNGFGFRSC